MLERTLPIGGGITEMRLSPNGKEMAYVFRGEIFVGSVEGGLTKRVTNTPGQERSVSFSPDGRSLVYAAERDNNWNVYTASIVRKEEPYFFASTVLKEEPVVATAAEEFQPEFSPDGKEVAYLENRVVLKVVNLASKQTRMILPAEVQLFLRRRGPDLPVEPRRQVVPGPVRFRPPVHPAGRARFERRQGQGRRPDQERLRRLHAPLGDGRDDDDLRQSQGGRRQHRRLVQGIRRLRHVLHPGRLRPVPPVQGGVRPRQGAGGQGQGGKGQGRQGQAQGQGRGGQAGGAQEGPRLRARRHRPAQGPPDHPLGRHRRHGPDQERREALLPGPLREGLRPVDDRDPDARHQALLQAGREPDAGWSSRPTARPCSSSPTGGS